MKKLLGILVLGLLLISNTVEAKSKSIGNGLTINIPKKYKHFEINFKKLTSTFPAIKKMLDEDEIDKEEFENFGIGPNAKLLVIADNQKPIAILKKLFSSGGLEKIMKKDICLPQCPTLKIEKKKNFGDIFIKRWTLGILK